MTPLPNAIGTDVDEYGDAPEAALLTLGWSRDSRDNVLAPTRGRYQRIVGSKWLFQDLTLNIIGQPISSPSTSP